ncbi:MAG: hypothetical protein DRQ49_16790 [Gammaproteobacteria bacterium]|nr:MAG: hypothetical protein DRQ49_16790 [Gammaproteobacteria bacterium]RKZ38998.1 MAG: hypothetical protein DRQ41_11200 [Gammaproteobacteria bacterium]RKZ76774.1 MAG: hypothetical protein DRQ57_02415 [Gammaproteobacteria bacterium]
MQSAMHLKTAILPGGRIEVTDLKLPVGEWVDVFVLLPHYPATARHSAIDVLARVGWIEVWRVFYPPYACWRVSFKKYSKIIRGDMC